MKHEARTTSLDQMALLGFTWKSKPWVSNLQPAATFVNYVQAIKISQ